MSEGDAAIVETARRGRRWLPSWRLILVGVLLVALLALAIVWIERKAIATGVIDDELERRGVEARYRIEDLGLRRQRLVDVVIGDPARPDLIARTVIVDLSVRFDGSTKVERIFVEGARLRGRIEDGRLRLGAIDRLLPPPTGKPFELPDIDIAIADSAIALETPAGPIGVALRGEGNLADGFAGRAVARAPQLAFGDCAVRAASAAVDVAINDLEPHVTGPVRAADVRCGGGIRFESPQAALDAILSPALDRWRGDARVDLARGVVGGNAVAGLTGSVGFDGSAATTRGSMSLTAAAARAADTRGRDLRLAGRYRWSDRSGLTMVGDAGADRVAFGANALASATGAFEALRGTPLAPIGAALANAVRRAGNAAAVSGRFAIVTQAGGGAVRARQLTATTASGARLEIAGGDGLTYYLGTGRTRLDGTLALAGGGFPATRVALSQPDAARPARGTAIVAPMAAGAARLALGPIRFSPGPGGATRVDTTARISGPISGGSVTDLLLPVAGRIGNGFAFGERCVTARFRALETSGLRVGPSALPLCPDGPAMLYAGASGGVRGGVRLPAVRVAGRLGEQPITIASADTRVGFAQPGFRAREVAVRLGTADAVNRLDIAGLDGRFTASGIAGTFAGAAGKLAAVPLLMSDGKGDWTLVDGRLELDGGVAVADAAPDPRFNPVVSDDARLTFADGRIDATAWLKHPASGTQITRAAITHSLRTGRGDAMLDVPGLRFAPNGFQPDSLTRLTTGVVALVDGTVTGRGDIAWGPDGVSSTGTFSTQKTNLAAAFGPVEGLSTTVRFTDLLGLVSAPGQEASVDLVQSGIDVLDGRVRYQLLPGQQVRVETGRWPYAGGELFLEETVLDFSQPVAKRLVFRLVGFDAAAFVQEMEFDNIAATGTFDGLIPMIFEQTGGRIEGGRLVARAEGGTLSYIGELTDKDLGTYGKLAFDALKALRYSKLDIALEGALDGEFVTQIDLDGVARDPTLTSVGQGISGIVAGRALTQLAKIPFEFNITAKGPFRALLATARSLEDPTLLIQSALPPDISGNPAFDTVVQPQESDPKP